MNDKNVASWKQELACVAADLNGEELDDLFKAVGHADIELVEEPSTGLVMMQARDCFQVPFNLGEVLITTADVKFNGKRFRGMAMGDNAEVAVLLATIDALEHTDGIRTSLTDTITCIRDRVDQERAKDARRVASTKVSFDSMKKENVEFGTIG